MNMQQKSNDKSIVPAPKDIIASIIASVFVCIFNIVIKNFAWARSVLPDTLLLLLCGFIAVIVLIASYFILDKYGLKYAQILKYTNLMMIIGVCFIIILNFLAILLNLCEFGCNAKNLKEIYNSIENSIKNETLFATILCLLIIVYIWLHRRYIILTKIEEKKILEKSKEIIEHNIQDKATQMSSDIIHKFDSFSSTISELMKKIEFDTAMTSTIIPFSIDKEKNILKTYLITNTSYPEYTWMFPGGHVKFDENESPESVAKSRAKDEAGLDVTLVDLYSSFDLLSEDETENRISNMTVFNPPHYLYLFKLDKNTKCFEEKGHEYHIDAVYVGKVDKVDSIKGANHRLYIQLPINLVSQDEISQVCYKALRSYYIKYHVKSSSQKNIPDYVEKMLYAAYKDFVVFAEKNL